MAKKKKEKQVQEERERYEYYDPLHMGTPTSEKDELWAAQVLRFNSSNKRYLVHSERLQFMRDNAEGIIDIAAYKKFFDPILPDQSGGNAEFMKSNWRANPIYMHLDSIKEAQLKKLPFNYVCKSSDETSRQEQQEENDRMIGAQYLRQLLNEFNPKFGIRKIEDDEDPSTFIEQMQQQEEGQAAVGGTSKGLVETIKAMVTDNYTLGIYNEYIHKSGIEAGIEVGIKEYIDVICKFKEVILPKIIRDKKDVNSFCFSHYTSSTTGLPELRYHRPDTIWTSPFENRDGSDNTFWGYEEFVSFGAFLRMGGSNLGEEQLRIIFNKNRQSYGDYNTTYDSLTPYQRNNTKIKVGYHEFETQNMDTYAKYMAAGNKYFKPEKDDYEPTDYAKEAYNAERIEDHYNVWYKMYYIPLDVMDPSTTSVASTRITEQAKYIFNFGVLQDQVRGEGDDYKLAKSSLIIDWDSRFSFDEIIHSYTPELNKLWMQIQHDMGSSTSDGVIWAEEVITGMMKYVDSGDQKENNDQIKRIKALRYLKQTNSGIAEFTAPGGQNLLPQEKKMFEKVSLNNLDNIIKRLEIAEGIYSQILRALGWNGITEGQAPQPRQNFAGINFAQQSTENAGYNDEEAIINARLNIGQRMVYYIKDVIKKGSGKRYEQLKDTVGTALFMKLQTIKDVPLHRLNLSLENQLTEQFKAEIYKTADNLATAGIISPEMSIFIKFIENPKQAYAFLALNIRDGIRRKEAQEMRMAQMQAEQQNMEHQRKLEIIQAEGAIKTDRDVSLQQMENQVRLILSEMSKNGQIEVKEKIKSDRIEQDIVKNTLDKNKKEHEVSLEPDDAANPES